MSLASDPVPLAGASSRNGLGPRLDRWAAAAVTGGWGPLLAALLVLVSALPGLIALPPLDRDEARFAQATAQMLESGDVVNIRYLDTPRNRKPVGVNWMQALSVKTLSSVERRQIWAYRIPSLLGAMAAAAACTWGAAGFFGDRAGFLAGAMLSASFILSSEAFIAKTDAVLCGAVAVSMAALARLYGASRGVGRAGAGEKALFWFGQGVAILDKGPVGPAIAALALGALVIADRKAGWVGAFAWVKGLGWGWGLVLVTAMAGPWIVAITIATDGGFWTGMVQGDITPKLTGGHETHGGPPGLHALLSPLLFFPSSLLLPAALVAGWRRREEPGVRFALAWLAPAWIGFELLPTKLAHYTLPLYPALAWLAAAALANPARGGFGRKARWIGAALSVLAALALAGLALYLARRFADGTGVAFAILSAALVLAAGVAGAAALVKTQTVQAKTPKSAQAGLLAALALGVLAHMALTGGLAPRMTALWTSARTADRLARDGLDPRNGVTTGPVAVVGYAEPSLVFALGSETELDNAADGADGVAEGQPAIVEQREDPAFRAALAAGKVAAKPVDRIKGFDYSLGKPVDLTVWRSLAPAH